MVRDWRKILSRHFVPVKRCLFLLCTDECLQLFSEVESPIVCMREKEKCENNEREGSKKMEVVEGRKEFEFGQEVE